MRRSTGSNSSAGSQACAACKHQRRKCAPNCLLAPFFPANHQKDFLNAHKVFGVSHIKETIKTLDPHQRAIAMKSIIYQANIRANDPVGGCYRIICDLQREIDWTNAELEFVRNRLAICKAQAAAASQKQSASVDDQELFDAMLMRNIVESNYDDQASGVPLLSCKPVLSDVGEDIKPLLAAFDDKGAVALPFDSKRLVSDKLASKEEVGSIQHQQKHDLKDAASLFTLTNGKG